MTTNSKQELISKIVILLNELIEVDERIEAEIPKVNKSLEMLTIKECTNLVKGLSEHTVRQLVKQNKIPYVRAGQDNRGKVLINKTDLLDYLNMSA